MDTQLSKKKPYLDGILECVEEPVHRQVVHMLWHSGPILFLLFGFYLIGNAQTWLSVSSAETIASFFLVFAFCNFFAGLRFGLLEGTKKMFQWILFLTIAGLILVGRN